MKNNAEDRFVVAHAQVGTGFRPGSGIVQIWIDRATGVNYLYIAHYHQGGGGLTPLLDAEGKPIVTPLPKP